MEEDQSKKRPTTTIDKTSISNITDARSELNSISEVKDQDIESKNTNDLIAPQIPVSTAKDEKTSFTKVQKKFIKKLQKEADKLEKSIEIEIEITRQNKEIKKDIAVLTEKLIKSRSKKKIFERIEALKTLHRRLKRGELKIKKLKSRIQARNKMLEKIGNELPV